MILYLPMVSPINSCMFHPNPPFYYDNLAANGFENLNGWINWMPDWDQRDDIRTIWLNYRYNDDVYIWRPRYFTVMWFMAQKRQHVGSFRPALQNFYKEWHAGTALFGTSQDELMRREAGLSDLASIAMSQRKRSGFARRLIVEMFGGNEVANWASPTAMSLPTAAQLARFPLNDEGTFPTRRNVSSHRWTTGPSRTYLSRCSWDRRRANSSISRSSGKEGWSVIVGLLDKTMISR